MLQAILGGLAAGIALSFTLGTVFFSLIQNSIENGYKSGILIASGVVCSDALFIVLAYFSTQLIPENNYNWQLYASLAGGCLLWALGLSLLFRKVRKSKVKRMHFQRKLFFFVNGFLLNTLNPINFFIWVGIATQLHAHNYIPYEYTWLFFGCALLGIFSAESSIALSAHRLKRLINEKALLRINQLSGLVFILIGSKLFYDALTKYAGYLIW